MKYRVVAAIAVSSLVTLPASAFAQSGTAAVDTRMSLYLANGNTYSNPPAGGQFGILPFVIALNAGTGRVLTVSASGTASYCPGPTCTTTSPDGPATPLTITNLNASGFISGIQSISSGFLAGLFLGATLPAVAPASLNFTNLDFLTLAPTLGQLFFIGDGETSGAVTQQFFAPDDAQYLVLGIADGGAFIGDPGFYDDNAGVYTARFNVTSTTPEPSTIALVVTGLAAVGVLRRRRAS